MRVVGYVREAPGRETGDTVFSQAEKIRRWVLANGHRLVAMCQDPRTEPPTRDGYAAMLRLVSEGNVDAVVVPSLAVLSPDVMNQEVMLWDLRGRKVKVVSADDDDRDLLEPATGDPTRSVVRDLLTKQRDYQHRYADLPDVTSVGAEPDELMIELIE